MRVKCKKCGKWFEVKETELLFCPECSKEIRKEEISVDDLNLPEISNEELANLELRSR